MRIVYSSHYNIKLFGLENLHPFDSKKYGRAWNVLKSRFGKKLSGISVTPKRPVKRQDLAAVHTEQYLNSLKETDVIAEILEIGEVRSVPFWAVDSLILRPMRWACAGSVLGATQAIQHGLAVNLGGGYHHASTASGAGFCVYSDIALAIDHLRKTGMLGREDTIAYIDLDAHQGDGVCHSYIQDRKVQIFDMYSECNFPNDPVARQRIDWDLPIGPTWSSEDYIIELKNHLPEFLDTLTEESSKVGFAVYNAGTDVLDSDPLGTMAVTPEAILERDLFVIDELRKRDIPTLMLLSGGYTKISYQLVANSISKLIEQA